MRDLFGNVALSKNKKGPFTITEDLTRTIREMSHRDNRGGAHEHTKALANVIHDGHGFYLDYELLGKTWWYSTYGKGGGWQDIFDRLLVEIHAHLGEREEGY